MLAMALSPIRLSTFGGVSLQAPDASGLPISSRKALALLVYVSLSLGRAVSRNKLADVLWSDRGPDQARNSLRQTLTVLRRDLGPGHGELLRADRDVVALDPGLLDHDARSFLASVALGTTQGLQAAADLYRGPFLDGFLLAKASLRTGPARSASAS